MLLRLSFQLNNIRTTRNMSQDNIDKLNRERQNTKRNNIYAYVINEVMAIHGKVTPQTVIDYMDVLKYELTHIFNAEEQRRLGPENVFLINTAREVVYAAAMRGTNPEVLMDIAGQLHLHKQ